MYNINMILTPCKVRLISLDLDTIRFKFRLAISGWTVGVSYLKSLVSVDPCRYHRIYYIK